MKILTLALIRFYQYGLSPHLKTLGVVAAVLVPPAASIRVGQLKDTVS
jgi:hypothetical protein